MPFLKSFFIAALVLLPFRAAQASESIVHSYWSPTDLQAMIAGSSTASTSGQPVAPGAGFPLLLVFSADGRLSWHGNPRDYRPMSMQQATAMTPGSDLASALAQMESATRLLAPEGTPVPAGQHSNGAPTVVLVVLATEAGLCPPCDRSLEEFTGFQPEWNRIVVALTGQW